MGVGRAWKDHLHPTRPSLYYRDLHDRTLLVRKLTWIRAECIDHAEQALECSTPTLEAQQELQHMYNLDLQKLVQIYQHTAKNIGIQCTDTQHICKKLQSVPMIFEGAQGVLLDPERGCPPHITKTRTTPHNARIILQEAEIDNPFILGITRAYATRHGAGPFPTENPTLEPWLPEEHNGKNIWQGTMRMGWLDLFLLHYATLQCEGVDGIALTHLDRWKNLPHKKIAYDYQNFPKENISKQTRYADFIEDALPIYKEHMHIDELIDDLPAPVSIRSSGASYMQKTVFVF